jgi:hypothetical protein
MSSVISTGRSFPFRPLDVGPRGIANPFELCDAAVQILIQ